MEKIIKAINICLEHGNCKDCIYHSDGYSDQQCRVRMLQDILGLLKPIEPERIKIDGEGRFLCGKCKALIPRWGKFCTECEQKVLR